MARLLGVGIVTLDIINQLSGYPAEDAEVRVEAQLIRLGGNASNTLGVLSQLGHRCTLAATLSDDASARQLRDGLKQGGINTRELLEISGGATPTSYIVLNRLNGSRTIVHHRDLPEYPASAFAQIELNSYQWLHFEGRNVAQLAQMLKRRQSEAPQIRCSLEVEKPREQIESLFGYPDLLFFSRAYATAKGHTSAEALLRAVQPQAPQALLVCAWGEAGAWALESSGELLHSPAYPFTQVVDTLGAGDTFNAGMINALLHGSSTQEALQQANRLAGLKCGQAGFDGLGQKFGR